MYLRMWRCCFFLHRNVARFWRRWITRRKSTVRCIDREQNSNASCCISCCRAASPTSRKQVHVKDIYGCALGRCTKVLNEKLWLLRRALNFCQTWLFSSGRLVLLCMWSCRVGTDEAYRIMVCNYSIYERKVWPSHNPLLRTILWCVKINLCK